VRPVWAEVDLSAIARNVATLRSVVAPARFCAVVKADGYGHGAVPSARAALAGGAEVLAVALAAEGAELRAAGIDAPVLVLSEASVAELDELVDARLDATVYTLAGVARLEGVAAAADQQVQVHVKVDTGMHRVGAQPDEVLAVVHAVVAAEHLALGSVFTHCAVADEPDNPFTGEQLARFRTVLDELAAAGIEVPCTHAANTAAALDHREARLDLVRCGIGIYGIAPAPALADRVVLEPAMSLRARVSHVKRVRAGEGISYGLRYRPATDATIATVPLGYADGLPRRLGQLGGTVLLGGRHRPIAGSVTMDQILVDCGDDEVAVGDEVVLLGRQGDATITADDWAALLGTIAYEIVCGISLRVPRTYLEDPR
jgi:alanine racemase